MKCPPRLREAHELAWARRQHFKGFNPQEEFLGAIMVGKDQNTEAVNRTRMGDKCPSHHAEIRALGKIANPKGATLYVARVDAHGRWATAKPCRNCEAALRRAGVKKVYYTNGPDAVEQLSL